jgi:uncharacterized membrane protein
MTYLAIKYLHIFLAIAAVGANLTYAVWFARARLQPDIAGAFLRGVKFLDDYIANPAYVLLLITGALMVWIGHIGFETRWVLLAVGLWLVVAVLGLTGYSPLLRRYIVAVDNEGIESPRARSIEGRANLVTVALTLSVLAILYLMVFKPT